MDQLRPQNRESLDIFIFISILLILCLPNVSKPFYHGTEEDQLSENT